jgi:ATP-dependent exoDNAse (exonuclease V) beta subunit
LTDRILALLATVSRPEEIVAITFTRKAAAEMHARVLKKLELARDNVAPKTSYEVRSLALAQAVLARSEERSWHLLAHPARLSIKTIDSFCASLVRSMPWLSGLGGMPTVAEEPNEHYLAAAREVFASVGTNPSVAKLLEHMDLDVQAASTALAKMLGQRDQWMTLLPTVTNERDRNALEDHFAQAVSEELSGIPPLMPLGYAQELAPLIRQAVSFLATAEKYQATYDQLKCLQDWDGQAFDTNVSDLPRWRALAELLITGAGTVRKTINVKHGFESKTDYCKDFNAWLANNGGGDEPSWAKALQALEHLVDERFSDAQWDILKAQIECLWLAVAQLQMRFATFGEVDFAEIAQRAFYGLGRADDPTELLLKLDSSIRHLLIDEFQDTSQTQLDLLERLTSGWQADDGRTVFLVGDPMQSIYRFRKAEVGLFLKVRDQGLGDLHLTPLRLTDNFRSGAGIVDWVNNMFTHIFPKQDDAIGGAITYAPSVAFNEGNPEQAVHQHLIISDDKDEPARQLIVLVKEALAAAPDSEHPVAILVRTRSNLRGATELLAKENLPYRAVELVALNQRAYVVDLVQIVRALCHLGDRAAWLAVLRSPYCGLTLFSLHRLFAGDKRAVIDILEATLAQVAQASPNPAEQVLEPDQYARLVFVARVFSAAVREETGEVFARKVQRVWQQLDGPALARHTGDVSDAESVFRLIERLAPYGGLDLDMFESRLTKLYASSVEDEATASVEEKSKGVVEVMTMHKSKGLQFDTVILFGLHEKAKGDDTPLVRIEQAHGRLLMGPIKSRASDTADPYSNFLGQREKRRASHEVDRLLYVAATRAKKTLHLVARLKIDKKDSTVVAAPESSSLLARLWPFIQQPTPLPEQDERRVESHMPFYKGPLLQRRATVPAMGSPSRTTIEPLELPGNIIPMFNQAYVWGAEAGRERLVGTIVHEWLAHIGESGLERWTTERITSKGSVIERQLGATGLSGEQASLGAQEAVEVLRAMLTQEHGRRLLGQIKAKREWALLDENGQMSIMDLVLDEGDHWLVVDYKTSRPAASEPLSVFEKRMLARYKPQLQRYCQQLFALDGRPAKAALYFPRDDLWVEMDRPC